MNARGSATRFTAVIALVVLALTGFSTGRHHGRRHSGGGGCSSSRQDHDATSSGYGGSYTHRPAYRPTHRPTATRTSGAPVADGTARLVSCASERTPYATVEVTNPNGRRVGYRVEVTFRDASGGVVLVRTAEVAVPARDRATLRVPVTSALVARVDHCEVAPRAHGA